MTKVWPQMRGRQALHGCGPTTAAAPQSAWGAQEVAGGGERGKVTTGRTAVPAGFNLSSE